MSPPQTSTEPTAPPAPEPPAAESAPSSEETASSESKGELRRVLLSIFLVQGAFLLYRLLFTLTAGPYAIGVFAVEVATGAALLLLSLPLFSPPAAPDPPPPLASEDESPTVDVVVPAVGSPVAATRRTTLAAIRLQGGGSTVLIGDSPEIAALSEELGCIYVEAPGGDWIGTLNVALSTLSGNLIAIFEPGQVPHIDFLDAITPALRDPSTAMVQARIDRPSLSQVSHGAGADALSTGEVTPEVIEGRDRWNAVPWLGTNAVFRRSALADAGGFARGPAPWGTSARLQADGWLTRYERRALSSSLEDGHHAIAKQARGASLGSLFDRRLSLLQRLCLLADVLAFMPQVAAALYLTAPILVVCADISPVPRASVPLVLIWLAVILATWAQHRLLHRHAPNLDRIVRLSLSAALSPARSLLKLLPSLHVEALWVGASLALALGLWSATTWVSLDLLYDAVPARWHAAWMLLWAAAGSAAAWSLHMRAALRAAAASGSREAQAIPVEYMPASRPGEEAQGSIDPKVGVARDVGGQGIGLLVEEELELGAPYELALRVFGEVIRMSATVVYEEPGGGGGECRYFLRPDKRGLEGLTKLARAIEAERVRQKRSRAMERARKVVRRPAKRRAPRYPIELSVQIDEGSDEAFRAVTIDVSTTGAALRADRELAKGSEIELRFIHPELPERISATVVSCSPGTEENTWRIGLDLSTPNAALARIASPPDAPLFLDPWDVDHDAMTQRGLRGTDAETAESPASAAEDAPPEEEAPDEETATITDEERTDEVGTKITLEEAPKQATDVATDITTDGKEKKDRSEPENEARSPADPGNDSTEASGERKPLIESYGESGDDKEDDGDMPEQPITEERDSDTFQSETDVEEEENRSEPPTEPTGGQRVALSSVRDTLAEIESSAEADPMLEDFADGLDDDDDGDDEIAEDASP